MARTPNTRTHKHTEKHEHLPTGQAHDGYMLILKGKKEGTSLAGVAQLVGCHPTKRKVPSLSLGQGHVPGLWVQSLVGASTRGN